MAVSDQLTKLAARAKEAEDRAAAAQGKARADLELDVETARTSAQAQADKLRAAADAKKGGQSTTSIGPREGPSTPKKMPPLLSTSRTGRSRRPSTRRSTPYWREWR